MTGTPDEGAECALSHRICVRFSTSSTSIATAFFSGPENVAGETTTALLRSIAGT
jgi:hypothetical protein